MGVEERVTTEAAEMARRRVSWGDNNFMMMIYVALQLRDNWNMMTEKWIESAYQCSFCATAKIQGFVAPPHDMDMADIESLITQLAAAL